MEKSPERPLKADDIWFAALFAAMMSALYVIMYRLSDFLVGNEAVGGVASVIFLPAFVRLLGFLVIRWWIVPGLFVAGLFCVDLGLSLESRIFVSLAIAFGAPVGIYLVARATNLSWRLAGLNAMQLLWLSLGSASGNALFYNTAVATVRPHQSGENFALEIFLGDALGTWIMILIVKWLLTLAGRFGT